MTYSIETAKFYLKTLGVVPLDVIFSLAQQGLDFSELDEQYNINN